MMREGWKKYQKSAATDRDVARHICFTHDFMYNVLDTSPLPGGRTIWINDLKGALCAHLCAAAPLCLLEYLHAADVPSGCPESQTCGQGLVGSPNGCIIPGLLLT